MVILSVPEILSKKRNGDELQDGELEYFIECVCNEEIDRSQVTFYNSFGMVRVTIQTVFRV